MFKKAFKKSLPFAGGSIIGLVVAGAFLGVQVAIHTIFPMLFGIAVVFILNLCFESRNNNDKG